MPGLLTDWVGAFLALAVLAGAPLAFGSSYAIGVLTVALCYGIWAASWDFMSGLTGRENFGHALINGEGAYTSGILNVNIG
jgi:branched-chain amino acid transport system permease protein